MPRESVSVGDVAVFEWDTTGLAVLANPVWRELVAGHEASWMDALHPDDRDSAALWVEQTLKGESRSLDVRFGNPQGSTTIKRVRMIASVVGEGDALRIVGTAETLQGSSGTFAKRTPGWQAVIDAFPDAVVVHQAGIARYTNPAFSQLLGLDGDAKGKEVPLRHFIHSNDLATTEARYDFVRRAGSRRTPATEVRWVRADGETIVLEEICLAFPDAGPDCVLSVARDVTLRNRIQNRAMVADRLSAVGRLAAGVAHEINNPLSTVTANLEWLKQDLRAAGRGGDSDAVENREVDLVLSEMRDAADRIRRIVADLQSVADDREDSRQPIDVCAAVDTALRLTTNNIRYRARIERNFNDVPRVMGNEGRLVRALVNILLNSAQSIPDTESGTNAVIVTVSYDMVAVIIDVVDTGKGIPESELRHVFEPFYSTRTGEGAAGLGLAVANAAVVALGGTIDIASEVDRGTRIRIRLPPSREMPAVFREVVATKTRGRVLVVDDEPLLRSSVTRLLGKEYDVVTVESAVDALARITRGERFDVILSDVMMPVMTGMGLHAEVSAIAPEQAERMVFMTGGAVTPAARRFLQIVPNPRIVKPLEIPMLRSILRSLIAPAE